MKQKLESKYYLNLEELAKNSSQGIILSQITPGSTVLECGCASAYMTRYMREILGADVSIIEMNSSDYEKALEYAVDGICTDLEGSEWSDYFCARRFDYILFADVLEHLRNPEHVMKRAVGLLKEDGTIIASIPNVAHADILINLLNGRWNYTPLGLLDDTHIHFWAVRNMDDLFLQAGLSVISKDYTILPPFTTEQKSLDKIEGLLPAVDTICHQPYADVYQFIYCANKTAYVSERGIACMDHYSERHSTCWAEPSCCLEYQEGQRRLAEQQAEQESLIQSQHAQIDCLEKQNRHLSETTETQQAWIRQLEEQNHYLSESFNTISNAACWKITKPVRVVLDFMNGQYGIPNIRRLVNSLRGYGKRAIAEKTERYLKQRQFEDKLVKRSKWKQKSNEGFRNMEEFIQACRDSRYTVYAEETLKRCSYAYQDRVLLISHELDLTGAPIVLSHMAEWFTENGLNPIVIARLDGPIGKVLGDKGIPVIVNESIYQSDFVMKCAHLFSLVVVNTIVGAPVIAQMGGTDVPVLWWIHEARVCYNPSILRCMPEYVKENIHIYCVSGHAERILNEYRPRYCAWQLPYFIPDYANMSVDAATLFPIDSTKKVFVCVGVLQERKGQDILVKAIRSLMPEERSSSVFVFVGRQYYLPIVHAIEEVLLDYPDNILYFPRLEHEEVMALYQKMDCLVCPSKDDPMPTTIAEAMSLSKLIICSENTGSAALLEKTGGGIIYHNDDPTELANCLAKVIRSGDDFREMRARAWQTYEDNFTREVFDARMAHIYRSLTAKEPLPVDVTVSVIIPTFNGGKDLPALLALLLKQVDVKETEIIVVDSGSTDDTLKIAEDFTAKIIQITQAEFSHSFARNLGAKNASGEYLLFMTQDAKPGSEHWVRDMAQPILRDVAVAVSCREEPRDDCDLLARFSIWIHSRYMGILEQDRVLIMPADQGCDAIRRNGQLMDVACMIRRDVFDRFEYRRNFAEDLDLGLRLIREGYRLSLLSSAPVIHSHNRPPYYHLKRCLVDVTSLKQIMIDFPVEKISEETATNRIIGMYAAIWSYVRELTKAQNILAERASFFAWSTRFFDAEKQKLRALKYDDFAPIIAQKPPFCDGCFHDFIQDLYIHASESFRVNTDWLDTRRNNILIELNDYLAYTGEPFTKETIEKIAELFVKHCGQVAGETLAYYTMACEQEESFLNDWVSELRLGV